MIEHHDPDRARSMRTAAVVELTFMAWGHSAVHTVRIGGNQPGLGNMLGIAIDQVIDGLPIFLREGDDGEMTGGPALVLTRESDGAGMSIHADADGELDELLKGLLVSARILALEDAAEAFRTGPRPAAHNGNGRG